MQSCLGFVLALLILVCYADISMNSLQITDLVFVYSKWCITIRTTQFLCTEFGNTGKQHRET